MTSTLIESTSDTAEIAAEPTLLTIMVSAVPMMELSSCSNDRNQKTADHAIRKHMLLLFHFSLNSPIIHFQTLPAVMPTLTLCSFPQDNASFYQRTYYGSSSYAIRGLPSGTCTMPQLTKPYFSNTCCITLLSVCVSIRICGTCALQ
jgi:hypothetical protein